MKNRFSRILVPVVIILAGLATVVILNAVVAGSSSTQSDTCSGEMAGTAVVSDKNGEHIIEQSCTVLPRKTVVITCEVSGRIEKMSAHLHEGYFVEQGELLFEVDPREYRLAVANLRAQMAQLTAEMAQTKHERLNAIANLEVEAQKVKLSDSEVVRRKNLLVSGALSPSEFSKIEMEHKGLEGALLGQKASVEVMNFHEELVRAKMEATQAELEAAELVLEKTKVFAPFRGIIAEKAMQETQYVQTGEPLLKMLDVSSVEVEINVPMGLLCQLVEFSSPNGCLSLFADPANANARVRNGGKLAAIRFRSGVKECQWEGRVIRVKPLYDTASGTVPAMVEIADPLKGDSSGNFHPLLPGMVVEVTVAVGSSKSDVNVSRAANSEMAGPPPEN